jgi:hypothetical protein
MAAEASLQEGTCMNRIGIIAGKVVPQSLQWRYVSQYLLLFEQD